jgi:hypothetical protein
MGSEWESHQKNVLRWYVLFKYPEGVPKDEGEKWFLNVHVPEMIKQRGLYRFFSYRVIKEVIPLPGEWPPTRMPPPETVLHSWDRLSELWYESFEDWRASVIKSPPSYTKPPWAKYDSYPFLEPFVDFVCSFLLERPNDEFLRDARGYL